MVVGHHRRRDGDGRHRVERPVLADRSQHRHAVGVGQLDVHQDQVGPALARQARAFGAGARLQGGVAVMAQDVAHELHVLLVVLDDQDGAHAASSDALGKNEREGRAPPGLALDPDRAAMELDEAPGQRQAEAGAFRLAQVVAAGLAEFLEHQRLLVLGDADAGVDDGDLDRVLEPARAQRDAPARGGELDRVREQVDDDLLELADVGDPVAEAVLDLERQHQAVAAGPLADQRRAVVEQHRQRGPRQIELHPAGLDLREVEDVVDQREQVVARAVDVEQVLELLVVDLAEHLLAQHLGEADDRVERRAQLVRHVGEELGLVLVRHLQLAALGLDLVEEARVLDRDHRLVGEGLEQRELLVGERRRRLARTWIAPTPRPSQSIGANAIEKLPAAAAIRSSGAGASGAARTSA